MFTIHLILPSALYKNFHKDNFRMLLSFPLHLHTYHQMNRRANQSILATNLQQRPSLDTLDILAVCDKLQYNELHDNRDRVRGSAWGRCNTGYQLRVQSGWHSHTHPRMAVWAADYEED